MHPINNHPPQTSRRRILRASLALGLGVALAATPAFAADWYLNKDQQPGAHWGIAADWNSKADNTGVAPVALSTADTCHTNGKDLRTPEQPGLSAFPGGVLVVSGGESELILKSTQNGGIGVPRLVTTAGRIKYYATTSGVQYVRTPWFENRSGTTTLLANGGQTLRIDAALLTGKGTTQISGSGTGSVVLDIADASSYEGVIHVASGTLNFDTDFDSAGRLGIAAGAKVVLDEDVTFTGLAINGVDLPVDHYTYSELVAAGYGAFFATGGTGSITVRAPATWYLSASQTSDSDWTTTSHWTANADGTGATAPSVNPVDAYVNQAPGRVLRTPSGSATFGGKALALGGGAGLVLGQAAGLASTVPSLSTSGSVTITNGSSGTRGLAVAKWTAGAGTTTVSTAAGGVTELRISDWIGAGNLTLAGAGEMRPYVGHTKAHTGTITVGSGAKLSVQAGSPFSTGGKLVVNSGGLVVLGDYIYCTALTVNGAPKPLGIYSAADLGAGFGGAGKIAVYTADLAGPPLMFGVNIAGADFAPAAIWQHDPAVWDYYHSKGLTLVRLPFKWKEIQSSPNATCDFTKLDVCIGYARERGMKVILDVHSYGSITQDAPWIGASGHPVEWMIDLWRQIAGKYKDESAVIGYDLMNEPQVGTGGTLPEKVAAWGEMVQRTIHAIRERDRTHYVYVEGLFFSNARNWHPGSPHNASLDVKDPVGRLVYSAHCYWDLQGDGEYHPTDIPTPEIGKNYVKPFVDWLKDRPYAHGHVGEYSIPNDYNVQGWETALETFLAYLEENNISGTYWAGGDDWQPSITVCHPQPFPGPDKSQMAVLEAYDNARPLANVFVDNKHSGADLTLLPNSGAWTVGTAFSGRYGENYLTDGNSGKGTKSAKFTPNLPAAGSYDVFLRWPTNTGWANNVQVAIAHAGGTASTTVNQSQPMPNQVNGWNPLGTFSFAAGKNGSVTIHTNTTDGGTVVVDAVWFRPSNAFPATPSAIDVGPPAVAGSSTASGGVHTLTSAGTIYGTADAFRFVYADVTGDCTLTARVVSQDDTSPYARAGVMIRDGLAANAAFADAIVTPGAGAYLQYRPAAGGTVTSAGGGAGAAPCWVRVQRSGNTFRAYKSTTGLDGSWVRMGTDRTILMGATVQAGLAACSFTTNTQGAVVFENVVLSTP